MHDELDRNATYMDPNATIDQLTIEDCTIHQPKMISCIKLAPDFHIYSQHKFTWFHKKMVKLLLGFTIEDVK